MPTTPPASIVARELTLRLASLLWRLWRATAIETGLLKTQAQAMQERKRQSECDNRALEASRPELYQLLNLVYDAAQVPALLKEGANSAAESPNAQHVLMQSYLRATNLYHGVLDRLTRYEVCLWRQVAQILLLLQSSVALGDGQAVQTSVSVTANPMDAGC